MNTGKITTIIIVLVLLIGLPLSSYLYLRKGMNFRLDAIGALTVKSHLPAEATALSSETVQILYSDEARNLPLVDSVRSHFGDHVLLQFVPYTNESSSLTDSLILAHSLCNTTDDYNDRIYLVNRQDAIVNCYDPSNLTEVKKLINHIAFLLPPEPEKDFDFRRSTEK